MKRSGPPTRKTAMRRDTPGARRFADQRSELDRTGGPPPVRDRPRRTAAPDHWPTFDEGRAVVIRRANGRCEVGAPGCTGAHEHTHHRKLRRAGDHRPVNLLACCHRCHDTIHHAGLTARPDGHDEAWSYVAGLIVRQTADPAVVPIRRRLVAAGPT